MICLENVSKIYHADSQPVRAVDDVSLSINKGEFVALRGPSGCGKSTLLALIGGLTTPTSGKVTIGDVELSSLSTSERADFRAREIGFVFQMFHLLPYLDVVENVLVAANDSEKSLPVARELLEKFGLKDRVAHRPGQLSAGERQRVAMARALLHQPSILLADEPTGNLDPANGAAVLDLLAQFHREGGTVVLVTHDVTAAARAERVIEMTRGRIASGAAS